MMLFESTAFASEAPAGTAGKQPSLFESMVPMLLIFVVMYFVMIRPQAKKAKEHANLLKNLKVGDEVVTSGGIIGRIKSVSDSFISLDTGGAALKVMKEHISRQSLATAGKEARGNAATKSSRVLKSPGQVSG